MVCIPLLRSSSVHSVSSCLTCSFSHTTLTHGLSGHVCSFSFCGQQQATFLRPLLFNHHEQHKFCYLLNKMPRRKGWKKRQAKQLSKDVSRCVGRIAAIVSQQFSSVKVLWRCPESESSNFSGKRVSGSAGPARRACRSSPASARQLVSFCDCSSLPLHRLE